MTRGVLTLFCVVVTGCGGTTPPAEEPDPAQAQEERADVTEPTSDEPADDGAVESPAADSESAASSTTLTDDELRDVIEQVLQDPGLDRHLHLDVRGRLPLKISGPGLPAKLEVTKGSYHVKVVDGPKDAKDPVVVFTRIERDGDAVRLRYRFDVEGISGSAVVFRKDGAWTLGSNRVIER